MNRKISMRAGLFLLLAALAPAVSRAAELPAPPASVEQWGTFELALAGPSAGNPFSDTTLNAKFTLGTAQPIEVSGFYDGDGVYRVRFMPPQQGAWHYETTSNVKDLAGKSGNFTCDKPSAANHGTVGVRNTFHFAYADGSPYIQMGTTCYAWTHEKDDEEELTLKNLKTSPFNKVRMCVLPTRFPSRRQLYPYMGDAGNFTQNEGDPTANNGAGGAAPMRGAARGKWDFTRFNVEFFQHLDKRVADLRDLNIEADLIILHPYENATGFNNLDEAGDARYIRYLIARLGAYRNVWWSLANEYDLMRNKVINRTDTEGRWDRMGELLVEADPYSHLRSVHFSKHIYNFTHSWVTHVSVQNGSAVQDFGRAILYRDVYNKPIVFDEVCYEGDLTDRWGRLTPEEMTAEFWHGTIDGTYVGHGDTYGGDQFNWISRGSALPGKSPERIAFLKKILEAGPPNGVDPIDKWQDVHTAGKAGAYYLIYFGEQKPTEWLFELPKNGLVAGVNFKVEVIDSWNMTIKPVEGTFKIITDDRYRYHAEGMPKIPLPGNPYMALRVTLVR